MKEGDYELTWSVVLNGVIIIDGKRDGLNVEREDHDGYGDELNR